MLVRILFACCLLGGFVLGSYGVVRESFADLASQSDVMVLGEGKLDAARLGGLRRWVDYSVRFGIVARLLPAAGQLTVEDHRHNAAAAIAGVVLIGIYTLREAIGMLCDR